MAAVSKRYDYVVLDCPPSLNILTVNALVAAKSVVIPTQCEYFALEGLSALMQTIERIRNATNSELATEGILRTMFDPRNNLALDVSKELLRHFGKQVFLNVYWNFRAIKKFRKWTFLLLESIVPKSVNLL